MFTRAALGCLLAHSFVEIGIDIMYTRTELHSRYGGNANTNFVHSFLFALAALTEVTYFEFMLLDTSGDEDFRQIYLISYLVAGHLWFLTAVFAFAGRGCLVQGAGLDNTGNVFYTVGACLMLFSGYDLYFFPNEFLGHFSKWSAFIMWTVAGMLYCIRDYFNLKGRGRRSPKLVDGDEADEPLHQPDEV